MGKWLVLLLGLTLPGVALGAPTANRWEDLNENKTNSTLKSGKPISWLYGSGDPSDIVPSESCKRYVRIRSSGALVATITNIVGTPGTTNSDANTTDAIAFSSADDFATITQWEGSISITTVSGAGTFYAICY